MQIEFLYNAQVINPFADIASIRKAIRHINGHIYYSDRFYGKDGIYIPYHVGAFKKGEVKNHTNNKTVVPFAGYQEL